MSSVGVSFDELRPCEIFFMKKDYIPRLDDASIP